MPFYTHVPFPPSVSAGMRGRDIAYYVLLLAGQLVIWGWGKHFFLPQKKRGPNQKRLDVMVRKIWVLSFAQENNDGHHIFEISVCLDLTLWFQVGYANCSLHCYWPKQREKWTKCKESGRGVCVCVCLCGAHTVKHIFRWRILLSTR